MTTTYEIYTNDGGTPKAVTGNAPAIVERVENLETNKLSLSGGTMRGPITSSVGDLIAKTTNDGYLCVNGGTNSSNGARLVLSGKDRSGLEGRFTLVARDASNEKSLTGMPNGPLTWDGKTVLTTDNGLPLSGGTMTGVIVHTIGDLIRQNATDKWTSIKGGTSDADGGYFTTYGKDHSNSGEVVIGTNDGTNKKLAHFYPDGRFIWDSKNVVRSVNGTSADSAGNVTISIPATPNAYVKASSMVKAGGYMWFSNGFLICWGNADVSKDATKTVTFAKAFSTVYGITTSDFYDTSNSWNFIGTSLTNTNATFRSSGMPRTFYYLAYGYAS